MLRKYKKELKVLSVNWINDLHYLIELEAGFPFPEILPGQFVEILIPNSFQTFLRRPISIHDVNAKKASFTMMIKIVGEGTQKLAEIKEGDYLDVIFPLGHGFSINKGIKKALLLGGGCGVAPLLYLARALKEQNVSISVIIAGKTSKDILLAESYKEFGEVFLMTENGELGTKGIITEHKLLNEELNQFDFIYTCGPEPMMKAIADIALSAGIDCEVSLENLMACGIGACLCCTVETHSGNLRACVEGPVFNAREIKAWTHKKHLS